MTIKECGFIVRKIRITTLDPLRCAVCGKFDYSATGKLWDKGAGEYEYLCLACETKILEDSEEVGE